MSKESSEQRAPKDSVTSKPGTSASRSKAAVAETVCGVCGDKTSSKHYGAYSCMSCKVFFRRSIWKYQVYFCEQNEYCNIKKDQQMCKACRLAKCLKIGMNPKMLHSSRNVPSKKQKKPPSSEASLLQNPCVDRSQIDALVLFDRHLLNRVDPPMKAVKGNVTILTTEIIKLPFLIALRQPSLVHPRTKIPLSFHRKADVSDVVEDFQRKFVLYADWLNEFSDFRTLPEYVQLAVAKSGFTKFNNMVNVWRTVLTNSPGINFINGSVFPKDPQLHCVPDPRNIVALVMRGLVKVMKSLNVDETEFVLLKIIVLFSEDSPDLNEAEKRLVREKRDKYLAILISYIQSKHPVIVEQAAACRVGELMLLLASNTHIADLISDRVSDLDIIKVARVGELMCEAFQNLSVPSSSEVQELST